MRDIMATRRKKTAEGQGKLIIHQEFHDPCNTT
jgi:hypothetical protein